MKTLCPVPRQRPGEGGERVPHREGLVLVVIVLGGQADLLEVVRALGTSRRLAGGLDGGQEQRDQDGDDRDHHQQLDQREAAGSGLRSVRSHGGSSSWRQVVGVGSGGGVTGPGGAGDRRRSGPGSMGLGGGLRPSIPPSSASRPCASGAWRSRGPSTSSRPRPGSRSGPGEHPEAVRARAKDRASGPARIRCGRGAQTQGGPVAHAGASGSRWCGLSTSWYVEFKAARRNRSGRGPAVYRGEVGEQRMRTGYLLRE